MTTSALSLTQSELFQLVRGVSALIAHTDLSDSEVGVLEGVSDKLLNAFAPFELLVPKTHINPLKLPSCQDANGAFIRDWDIYQIDGETGVSYADHTVEAVAEDQGIRVLQGGVGLYSVEVIDESGTKRHDDDADVLGEAVAAGLTLVRLPDQLDSTHSRWYVVDHAEAVGSAFHNVLLALTVLADLDHPSVCRDFMSYHTDRHGMTSPDCLATTEYPLTSRSFGVITLRTDASGFTLRALNLPADRKELIQAQLQPLYAKWFDYVAKFTRS